MNFHDQLTDKFTKERGGRHGGKGHEFQRYWALCHLLKLDLEQDDYLLLIEYIEDVAVFDAECTPSSVDLIQLKKKDGTAKWTKANLCRRPKDGLSVLAKLFESQRIIPESNATVAFISNAPVSLPLKSKMDSVAQVEFIATELDDSLKAELQGLIADELSCQPADIRWDKIRFVQCHLALNDLEKHAQGHVVAYLAQKFPDHSARADVLCKALYAEIAVRATNTLDAASFDELRRMRGISKTQLDEMLAVTFSRKPVLQVLDEALLGLTSEGVPFNERNAIRVAGRRFAVERTSQLNLLLPALEQQINLHLDHIPGELVTSWDVASWVYEQVKTSADWQSFASLDKSYVLAVVLYGIYQ